MELENKNKNKKYGCFISRDLSWLQFNIRVANEAADKNVPLLERVKFLSIYQSNLEEFFMVRIGMLIHRCAFFPKYVDPRTGLKSEKELANVLEGVRQQQEYIENIYSELLLDLNEAGIDVVDFRRISKVDEGIAKKFFTDIKPFVSARIVDARHPLQFIDNKETCICALLGKGNSAKLGIISGIRIPKYKVFECQGRQKVMLTNDVLSYFAGQLFKEYDLREVCAFKVTRNADVFLEGIADANDFKASMEKMLRKRKREQPVRLQLIGRASNKLQNLLASYLKIDEKLIFTSAIPVDYSFTSGILAVPGMKYEERKSVKTVKLKKGQLFKYLEKKDLLLSFPHQSMQPFVELLYEAGDDPDVVSIQITLYRLSSTSQVAAALAYAANQGKSVTCLLELRARFDEQNNIDYSEMLADAGCNVIYGLRDMKVHSKLCLITRKKGDAVSYITQVGTGNYNEVTSELYCDLSLITSDMAVGQDAAVVFEALEQGKVPETTKALMVAPVTFKSRVMEFLDAEKEKGENGRVSIKANSINDMDVMRKLIECSQTGVRIELFIRGICSLKPGIPGYTDNITVKSVVGRYLEHSRILVFGEGDEQRIFMGSGDFLTRNTEHRVEIFIEVRTEETRAQVLEVMEAFRCDREKCSGGLPDGTYIKKEYIPGTASQDRLYNYFSEKLITEIPKDKTKNQQNIFVGLWNKIRKFLKLSVD